MCKGQVAFPLFTLTLGTSIDYFFIIVITRILTFAWVSFNLTITGHYRKKMKNGSHLWKHF